jgi:CRP-like cAMP-binding protein
MSITKSKPQVMGTYLYRPSDTFIAHSYPAFIHGGPQVKLDPSAFVADPELIQALEKHSTAITCDADRVLFKQGDHPLGLYILDHGETTITMVSSTGEQLMSIQAYAGSLLGLPGLIGNEPYTLTAIARNGARLNFISRDEFSTLMRTEPILALKMVQVIAAELRSARRALANL